VPTAPARQARQRRLSSHPWDGQIPQANTNASRLWVALVIKSFIVRLLWTSQPPFSRWHARCKSSWIRSRAPVSTIFDFVQGQPGIRPWLAK
jgi:hypothetical protein